MSVSKFWIWITCWDVWEHSLLSSLWYHGITFFNITTNFGWNNVFSWYHRTHEIVGSHYTCYEWKSSLCSIASFSPWQGRWHCMKHQQWISKRLIKLPLHFIISMMNNLYWRRGNYIVSFLTHNCCTFTIQREVTFNEQEHQKK